MDIEVREIKREVEIVVTLDSYTFYLTETEALILAEGIYEKLGIKPDNHNYNW